MNLLVGKKRLSLHIANVLSKESKFIVDLLKRPVKKLLYCDNGNKIKEVHLYSKYLISGDMLGVHDWHKEIDYEDIKDCLVGFKPVEHEIFEEKGFSTRLWIKE